MSLIIIIKVEKKIKYNSRTAWLSYLGHRSTTTQAQISRSNSTSTVVTATTVRHDISTVGLK